MSVSVLAFLLWKINKWVAMFGVLVCLSSLFPQYDKATFLASHCVFYALVWYYAVYEKGSAAQMLNAMCVIALANIVFLVLQFFDMDPLLTQVGKPVGVGLMTNPNEVSALLALCFPAFLRKKWAYFTPVVIIGLILAKSFGGVVAVVVGVMFYAYGKIDKFWIAMAGLGSLMAFALVDMPGFSHRLDTWIIAAKLFVEHPVTGCGVGHWKYVFSGVIIPGHEGTRMLTAHNEFVQGAFEMGVFFIVVLVGFTTAMTKRLRELDDKLKVAVVIIFVNCFVNFTLHIAVTAYLVLTWIAIIDRSYYNEENRI
jgi:hypothetical protein